jgi:hypothetical protein
MLLTSCAGLASALERISLSPIVLSEPQPSAVVRQPRPCVYRLCLGVPPCGCFRLWIPERRLLERFGHALVLTRQRCSECLAWSKIVARTKHVCSFTGPCCDTRQKKKQGTRQCVEECPVPNSLMGTVLLSWCDELGQTKADRYSGD